MGKLDFDFFFRDNEPISSERNVLQNSSVIFLHLSIIYCPANDLKCKNHSEIKINVIRKTRKNKVHFV